MSHNARHGSRSGRRTLSLASHRVWTGALLGALMIISLVALLGAATPAAAAGGASGLTRTPISFIGQGGVRLSGIVVSPTGDAGRLPGVVLVSGAGPTTATDELGTADAFARGGVVTLAYTKRTEDYTQFARSYQKLATDALAGVRALERQPGVDPARVGLWGESEGAWVASLAASESSAPSFLVTVGASGVSPARQTAWSTGNVLRHAGVSGSLLQAIQQTGYRLAVGAGAFPEANYDPIPAWQHVRQPVLALWGAEDRVVPAAQSSRIIRLALTRGGNSHYTMRFFPEANHQLEIARNGGFGGSGTLLSAPVSAPLVPAYPRLVTSWILDLPQSAAGPSAGTAPSAGPPVPVLAPLRWYESPRVELAGIVLILLALASYPLTGISRRLRRGGLLSARVLAASGLVTALGTTFYLLLLTETAGAVGIGPLVIGIPLPWLVLRLLALVAAAAVVWTAVTWWRRRYDLTRAAHLRLAAVLLGGIVLIPWAAYWGVLRPW